MPSGTIERHGLVEIAELTTGKVRLLHKEQSAPVRGVGFSRRGDYFVSSARGLGGETSSKIRVWDVASFKERFVVEPDTHQGTITITPFGDGDIVAADLRAVETRRDTGGVLLFDLKSGHKLQFVSTGFAPLWTLAISPDGRFLAGDSDKGAIQVWDMSTKTLAYTLKGHELGVKALKFISKDQILVSGGDDGKVRFWDMRTGLELRSLECSQGEVLCLDVSADDKLLATGGADTTILVWEIEKILKPVGCKNKNEASVSECREISTNDLAELRRRTRSLGCLGQIKGVRTR